MTSNKVYSRCCMPSKVHLSANKHSILHLLSCMVLSNDIVHMTCSPAMVFCVCCHKMIVGILLQWRNIHISQCPVWFSAANFSIVVAKLSWNTVEYYFYMFTHSYRFLLLLPTSFHLGSWVSTTWLWTPSLSVQVSLTSTMHNQRYQCMLFSDT